MEKAKFFGGTLACFHLGVAAGYGLWLLWGVRSIWACALPLCACGLLVRGEERRRLLSGGRRCRESGCF